MKNDQQPLNEKSRSQQRSKRRKTNIILNSLIVIILLLIVIVSVNIFFNNDETVSKDESKVETKNSTVETDSKTVSATSQSDKKTDTSKNKQTDTEDEESTSDDKNSDSDQNDQEDIEDQQVITEGGSDPDVNKTVVNPAWDPVGTAQTGQHSNVYGGVDWEEMVQAITYGTGIEESNMTIVYLGNNGPNKSVGTVKQKDTGQEYRVYIEWVDEKGWKPTLVEELAK